MHKVEGNGFIGWVPPAVADVPQWEFLHDAVLYQCLEGSRAPLDSKSITVDLARSAECTLAKRFIDLLAQKLPEKYKQQKAALKKLNVEIIPNVSLFAVKKTLLELRDSIVAILTEIDPLDLSELEKVLEHKPMPKLFLILFEIAQLHILLNEKSKKGNLPIGIKNGRQMRFVSLVQLKQEMSDTLCKKLLEREEFAEFFQIVRKLYLSQLNWNALIILFIAQNKLEGAYEIERQIPEKECLESIAHVVIPEVIASGMLDLALELCKLSNPRSQHEFIKKILWGYLDAGQFDKAVPLVKEPSSLQERTFRAMIESGHYSKAKEFRPHEIRFLLKEIEKEDKIDAGFAPSQRALELAHKGNFKKAVKHAEKMCTYYKDETLFKIAKLFIKKGHWEGLSESIRAITDLDNVELKAVISLLLEKDQVDLIEQILRLVTDSNLKKTSCERLIKENLIPKNRYDKALSAVNEFSEGIERSLFYFKICEKLAEQGNVMRAIEITRSLLPQVKAQALSNMKQHIPFNQYGPRMPLLYALPDEEQGYFHLEMFHWHFEVKEYEKALAIAEKMTDAYMKTSKLTIVLAEMAVTKDINFIINKVETLSQKTEERQDLYYNICAQIIASAKKLEAIDGLIDKIDEKKQLRFLYDQVNGYIKRGQPEKALDIAWRREKLEQRETLLRRIYSAFLTGRKFNEALKIIDQIVEVSDCELNALKQVAQEFALLGRWDEAMAIILDMPKSTFKDEAIKRVTTELIKFNELTNAYILLDKLGPNELEAKMTLEALIESKIKKEKLA